MFVANSTLLFCDHEPKMYTSLQDAFVTKMTRFTNMPSQHMYYNYYLHLPLKTQITAIPNTRGFWEIKFS